MSGGVSKVCVAVRVRPFNRRELELGTENVVECAGDTCSLFAPNTTRQDRRTTKQFRFDHCFDSTDIASPNYSDQATVFDELGLGVVDNGFEGYNACIFAYGQTGSGKSYTMMGGGASSNPGVVPRLCHELFRRISTNTNPAVQFKVELSYMEIYNEKVRDLLDPCGRKENLRVREHKLLGPYVDGLSRLAVTSSEDVTELMEIGNQSRTVASTNMNSESSRSHAVFTLFLSQHITNLSTKMTGEKASRISLVDLAGSERATKTGACGDRLKEGSNINRSLTTLGLVISALAEQSAAKKKAASFVPYRDSVLTWLLKDSLGGNSKTVMIATISPAADNYDESLSTLRYADRAKRIVNHAVINEDPNAKLIRELREEVDRLRKQLADALRSRAATGLVSNMPEATSETRSIRDQLAQSEKLINEMSVSWEQRVHDSGVVTKERLRVLETMGISMNVSGMPAEDQRIFLVNLNSDPSLNEVLKYFLKPGRTSVGHQDSHTPQDIQLTGLGIKEQHCVLSVEDDDVFLTTKEGARTCVNGLVVHGKVKVKHGDRILWGNNHFFKLNCPKTAASVAHPINFDISLIDYQFATSELLNNENSAGAVNGMLAKMESVFVADRQEALARQKEQYERHIAQLHAQLSSQQITSVNWDQLNSIIHPDHFHQWAQKQDEEFRNGLLRLKELIMHTVSLVREANGLASEMDKKTTYKLTLQIPPANLSANRRTCGLMCEPAVVVRRVSRPPCVWNMEKMENRIVEMRDAFNEWKQDGSPKARRSQSVVAEKLVEPELALYDPFFEAQDSHDLIGVANVFLEALFYDVVLTHNVPIISQQGEVVGKLRVELQRVSGNLTCYRMADAGGGESSDNCSDVTTSLSNASDDSSDSAQHVTLKVRILEASGLPPQLSNFVFCTYALTGSPGSETSEDIVTVVQVVDPDNADKSRQDPVFNHEKELTLAVSEELFEHCVEGSLAIEVYGHRVNKDATGESVASLHDSIFAKNKNLIDRWREMKGGIELWVEIQEINDQGEFAPVDVLGKQDVPTGGVYQLKQGHMRHIKVSVNVREDSGCGLPLAVDSVVGVQIGAVTHRNKTHAPLDSFQDDDLNRLRQRWSDALSRRKQHLELQLKALAKSQSKSDSDRERENILLDQWVSLTEERNAVLVPAPGSSIPGAKNLWDPVPGMEPSKTVLFMDLDPDEIAPADGSPLVCANSAIANEQGERFFPLPIIARSDDPEVCATVTWDSSVHGDPNLNRPTAGGERIYLILKVFVHLSMPAPMDLVLRKRLCCVIYRRPSLASVVKKKLFGSGVCLTGISYEIVSHVPQASEDMETRESLALLATSSIEEEGESNLERYTRSLSAVEGILAFDRLKQEVAILDALKRSGKSLKQQAANLPFLPLVKLDSSTYGSEDEDHARPLRSYFSQNSLTMDPNSPMWSPASSMASLNSGVYGGAVEHGDYTRRKRGNLTPLALRRCASLGMHNKIGHMYTRVNSIQSLSGLNPSSRNDESDDEVFSRRGSLVAGAETRLGAESSNTIRGRGGSHEMLECGPRGSRVEARETRGSSSSAIESVEASLGSEHSEHHPEILVTTTETDDEMASELGPAAVASMSSNQDASLGRRSTSQSPSGGRSVASSPRRGTAPMLMGRAEAGRSASPMMMATLEEQEETRPEKADGSSNSLSHQNDPKSVPSWVVVGARARLGHNRSGTVKYIGRTHFTDGTMVGVALDTPHGRHDGAVDGVRYFQCVANHGIFVKADRLERLPPAESVSLRGVLTARNSAKAISERRRANAGKM